MASKMQEKHLHTICPQCNYGMMQVPQSGQEWHLECTECSSIMFCYEPLPHQHDFHKDPSRIKGFFGGYGSGKTTTTVWEMIDHQLNTPNGTSLMGAATFPQLEQTSMKDWFEIMPKQFIQFHSKAKNYVDLINGHRILFRSLDDEGKARSLNLTAFHIEEASEVNSDYYVQLTTRLRNRATDNHLGILSSNPDMNWIKTDILLKAQHIYNSTEDYEQIPEEINPNISVHIAPTNLNTHLPPNFYEDTARNRPQWWIDRYLNGSFTNKTGLVYPSYQENIVDPFDIPKHWPRYQSSDFGINDPTVALWGATDPKTGVTYIYDEHYQNEKAIPYHAEQMKKRLDKIPHGVLQFVVGDPKGNARSEVDMKSVFDHYAEYGVYFQAGNNRIEDGIYKVHTFFELGIVKIFNTCKNTIREVQGYRYPEPSEKAKKNLGDKPIDKDNHAMDCLRYMIVQLPDDFNELKNQSFSYYMERNQLKEHDHLPHALQDDDTYDVEDWQTYY